MGGVYVFDCEFGEGAKSLPDVRCAVLQNTETGLIERFWKNNFDKLKAHEAFQTGSRLVAFYALAEIQSLTSIGVDVKCDVIDLFLIGKTKISKNKLKSFSLLSFCDYFKISHQDEKDKEIMRDLALRGGEYTIEEQVSLLDYCEEDVRITTELYKKMAGRIEPKHKIWGVFLKLACVIQERGVPVVQGELNSLLENRLLFREEIVKNSKEALSVYEGTKFVRAKFAKLLSDKRYSWRHTQSNSLDLSEKAFKSIEYEYPEIFRIGRVRKYLSALKGTKLEVEAGRVYSTLGPFGSLTGRNQPPGSVNILLHPSFFRGFISPPKGKALLYIDYSQQEFGIAAKLSGDLAMQKAYESGDPYMYFAKLAGAVPKGATKASHPKERAMYKQAILAVQYGMGSFSLAQNIKGKEWQAKKLLADHERTFSKFWTWSRDYVEQAILRGECHTKWGWELPISSETKEKTIANFPMQAGGAEILRLGLFELESKGFKTIAPLHDAVLIECDEIDLELKNKEACEILERASADYLDGFTLEVESKVIQYGERFPIEKDLETWEFIY